MSTRGLAKRWGWDELTPGAVLTVVKLAPDGSEAARYPGEVVAVSRDDWLAVRATWTYDHLALDGLEFHPGDTLLEWFSPTHPFNAFAVHAPDGRLRGWYGNVTLPARLDTRQNPLLLLWHDLYLDLIGLPDGTFTIRDEDELRDSGLRARDPALCERIVEARDELVRRFQSGLPPFTVLEVVSLEADRRRAGD